MLDMFESGEPVVDSTSLTATTLEDLATVLGLSRLAGAMECRAPGGRVRFVNGHGPEFSEAIDTAGRPVALAFYVRNLAAFAQRVSVLGAEVHQEVLVLGEQHLDIAIARIGQVWLELIERRRR